MLSKLYHEGTLGYSVEIDLRMLLGAREFHSE